VSKTSINSTDKAIALRPIKALVTIEEYNTLEPSMDRRVKENQLQLIMAMKLRSRYFRTLIR